MVHPTSTSSFQYQEHTVCFPFLVHTTNLFRTILLVYVLKVSSTFDLRYLKHFTTTDMTCWNIKLLLLDDLLRIMQRKVTVFQCHESTFAPCHWELNICGYFSHLTGFSTVEQNCTNIKWCLKFFFSFHPSINEKKHIALSQFVICLMNMIQYCRSLIFAFVQ